MYSAAFVQDMITKLKPTMGAEELAVKVAEACIGWPYVFGARGEYCDPSNRRGRASEAHPTIQSKCRNFSGKDSVPGKCVGCKWFLGDADADQSKHEGRVRFFDCRGFTYWVLLQVTGWKLRGAGATSQWNTSDNWTEKGQISSIPLDRVCCVFKRVGNTMEHTGLHVGGGKIIHCSNGVQTGKTTDRGWTHYAIPVCFADGKGLVPAEPGKEEAQEQTSGNKPLLKRGSRGVYVSIVQTMLVNRGYDIGASGVDGDFGKNTEAAVKAFQKSCGLEDDGVVGAATWAALENEKQTIWYSVFIPHLDLKQADSLLAMYPGATKDEERG